MFEIHWRRGVAFVTTPNGRYELRLADAQSNADILALAWALVDGGRGVAGGWSSCFVRGWLDES